MPARLLGILSRQAGPALSLQVSRALFSARSNLLTGRFGRSFPIEPGGPFHRPRGCRDFLTGRGSYGSRLPALISDPTGGCSDRRAAALRCGAWRSFINGELYVRRRRGHGRSRPVAILATADCGSLIAAGSHRAVPQSRAHGRPNTVVRSARRRQNEMGAGERSIQQGSHAVDGEVRCFDRCDAVEFLY